MKKQILELKSLGFNNDLIYQLLAGEVGLFHIAFFGHRLTDKAAHKKAKAKLNRIWGNILSTKINKS